MTFSIISLIIIGLIVSALLYSKYAKTRGGWDRLNDVMTRAAIIGSLTLILLINAILALVFSDTHRLFHLMTFIITVIPSGVFVFYTIRILTK